MEKTDRAGNEEKAEVEQRGNPKHNKLAAIHDASTGFTADGQNVNKQVSGDKQPHKTKEKSLPKLKIGVWNVRSLMQ